MHEYTVEFRILGREVIPSAITADLGVEPAQVRFVGEQRDSTTRYEEALWAYDGFPSSQEDRTWDSLEEGLRFVLERLWPVKDQIDSYKARFRLILWCGHFYSSFSGGPSLSPPLLKLLGDFGVELFIDNHFCES
ncbi:MAG TPA: hypothetical protein DC047_15960 [Blastocatellia bacterium]|nr:hypothetical protein [Blastocatellia bacterium]